MPRFSNSDNTTDDNTTWMFLNVSRVSAFNWSSLFLFLQRKMTPSPLVIICKFITVLCQLIKVRRWCLILIVAPLYKRRMQYKYCWVNVYNIYLLVGASISVSTFCLTFFFFFTSSCCCCLMANMMCSCRLSQTACRRPHPSCRSLSHWHHHPSQ